MAALEAFRSPALASKAILCRLLLARLALRMGDLDAARDGVRQRGGRRSGRPRPARARASSSHFVRGQIEQAAGEPARAPTTPTGAAQRFLETLRSSLRGEELKIAFMKNKLEVYESLVDLCPASAARTGTARRRPSPTWSRRSRAASRTCSCAAATPVGPSAAGKSELVRRVGELREELNWYYHRIEAEQMAPEERTAGARSRSSQAQVQAHESELLRVLRELPASESGAAGAARAR